MLPKLRGAILVQKGFQFNAVNENSQVTIVVGGKSLQVPQGLPLYNLINIINNDNQEIVSIVGAKYNNRIVDLYEEVNEDGVIELLDLTSEDGLRIYRQSMVFLLTRASYEVYPNYKIIVEHSLGKSYYCKIEGLNKVPRTELIALEAKMHEFVSEDEPIIPQLISRENAIRILSAIGREETVSLLQEIAWNKVKIHTSGSYSNYFYSTLAPSTGCLKVFKLEPYANGFLLRFPAKEEPRVVAPYPNLPKLGQVFRESEEWADILGVSSLAGFIKIVNKNVREGDNLIHVAEALQEKKIAQIADEIYAQRNKLRLVLIAGPSSSGKTTFAQRLATQLRVLGLKPQSISMDDYFVDREHTPRDENGEYDFEAIEAVDINLFNEHLNKLINCEEVECPIFNFHKGMREERGRKIKFEENDPIIIEGIHGLNEKLTASIAREKKYKIYISALTQISIDNHNRIPTTDTRLIRRIVRDNQFRSQNALSTLQRWPSVRKGEEKNIFPYQEEADVMFNSALIYELSVLKRYAYPLLKQVGPEYDEYSDAQRLLKLLSYFPEISDKFVPLNSILREFIGGSSYHDDV